MSWNLFHLVLLFFFFFRLTFLVSLCCSSLSYHQNIIRLVGYTEAPNAIITPMYQGDLNSFIHLPQHKYTSLDAMDMVQNIIAGMEAIHSLGLAHRDIKPGNCLLERRPVPDPKNSLPGEWSSLPYRVRLCDFGVCFVGSQNAVVGQKFKNVFGVSLRYAAPEILLRFSRGGGTLEDFQMADVYAFAILLWELVHRSPPWGPDVTLEVCDPFRPRFFLSFFLLEIFFNL